MIGFKIGFMGAGRIADVVSETISKLDYFESYAIAARDLDRAEAFKEKHGFKVAYGSYEELVNDPEVELIYIATVNSNHAELAKMCINAGKPCLVEKPFSYNAATTKEVLDLATEKNVFCGEAMWLRYTPMMLMLISLIREKNIIGPVKYISANLCYDLTKKERMLKLETAGGALLDIGIYPLTAVLMVMGEAPVSIASGFTKLNTGVDAIDTVQMNFKSGAQASIFTSMMMESDNSLMIYGAAGRIEVDNVNCPTAMRIYKANGELLDTITPPETQISGYEYEFLAAREAIITGHLDTPQHPRANIMQMADFMNQLRNTWQISFPLPGEKNSDDLKKMKEVADKIAEVSRKEQ